MLVKPVLKHPAIQQILLGGPIDGFVPESVIIGNHSKVYFYRISAGHLIHKFVRKEHTDPITAYIEAEVLKALGNKGAPVPRVYRQEGNSIIMEDVRYPNSSRYPEYVRVPLLDILRAFHQRKSEEGNPQLAIKLLERARNAYELHILRNIEDILESIRIGLPNGSSVNALEYLENKKHTELESAFPDANREGLARFHNFYEVLKAHKASPYFKDVSLEELAQLFEPLKAFDETIHGREIAVNTSPTNIYVGIPQSFVKTRNLDEEVRLLWNKGKIKDRDDMQRYAGVNFTISLKDIIDFKFIDFGSYRIGCEEQDMYWLFMHPEAMDPREGQWLNINSSVDKLRITHSVDKARKTGQEPIIITERFYLSALREGLRDIAFFNARGNKTFARYYHELCILISEHDPELRELTDFLKTQYKDMYGEPFNREVPFTIALEADYDPYGNFVQRRLPGISYRINPNVPSVSAKELVGWPCKEEGIIKKIHETTR